MSTTAHKADFSSVIERLKSVLTNRKDLSEKARDEIEKAILDLTPKENRKGPL